MRSATILLFALLVTGCDKKQPAEVESQPELKQFSLVVPDEFEVVPYSASSERWTRSLIKNLGYERDKVTCVEFLKTNLQLTSGGQPIEGGVYVHRSNQNLFHIREHRLTVDFEKPMIGTGGVGGMSVHFSSSGKMGAILCPTKGGDIHGVPLGDDKTVSPKPVFLDSRSVTYEILPP